MSGRAKGIGRIATDPLPTAPAPSNPTLAPSASATAAERRRAQPARTQAGLDELRRHLDAITSTRRRT